MNNNYNNYNGYNNYNNYNDYSNYNDYNYNNYNNYDDYYGYNEDNDYYNKVDLNLSKRIIAKIIDFFIFSIVHYLFVSLYSYYFLQNLQTKYILIGLFICILLNLIIEFLLIPSFIFRGQSIGKKIMRIKTLKREGYLVSFKEMFVEFLFIFIWPIDIIYCIKNKEFLHNNICNTFVKKIN